MKVQGSDGQIIGNFFRKKQLEYKKKKFKGKKWTNEYIAEQAELHEDYVGEFLLGKRKEPQFITIGKLADALDISTNEVWEACKKEKSKANNLDN